jgi:hypothetical protein
MSCNNRTNRSNCSKDLMAATGDPSNISKARVYQTPQVLTGRLRRLEEIRRRFHITIVSIGSHPEEPSLVACLAIENANGRRI